MPTFVDLSIPLTTDVVTDPDVMRPKITYLGHKESFPQLAAFFPGLKPEDMPDGEAWAVEQVEISTHNGTHMDAPWHFASVQDAAEPGGPRPAMTIDELPLDWCMRPGVKLDFRRFEDGYVATAADVDEELERIGHRLQPYDIVVVNTRAGERYGQADYLHSGCGLGREATLRLTEQGVRIVGTDAWSWDAPFSRTARRWAEDHDPAVIWEGHKAGRDRGYFQMEKLNGLERLPAVGWTLCCFPVKIARASAGWIRAVAILD